MPPKPMISWVKYEPRHMMMRCLGLSPLAELAHRRLCDYYWSTRRWAPFDIATIAEIIRSSPSNAQALLKELANGGWQEKEACFVHPEVREILDEAAAYREQASAKHRRAAHSRWHKTPDSTGSNELPLVDVAAPPKRRARCNANAMQMHEQYSTVHNSTLNAVKAERLTLSVSTREKVAPEEGAFLEQLEALLKPTGARKTALEMANWGGWWRNRFRENPDKTRRVIADVSNMMKEGTVIKSFGAAAVDLWKRLPD